MGKSLKKKSVIRGASRHELCIYGAGVQIVSIRRADSGFALLDLIFVCGLIGILSGIAVPKLLMAKQAAGAASAIGSMRAINSAELTYALTCGNGFYAPHLPALGQAPPGSNEPFCTSPDLPRGEFLGGSSLATSSSLPPNRSAVRLLRATGLVIRDWRRRPGVLRCSVTRHATSRILQVLSGIEFVWLDLRGRHHDVSGDA